MRCIFGAIILPAPIIRFIARSVNEATLTVVRIVVTARARYKRGKLLPILEYIGGDPPIGKNMWLCMPTRPGRTVYPRRSIVWALAGRFGGGLVPIDWILPSAITIVSSSRAGAPLPSIIRT